MSYFLGIDLSTQSMKFVVSDINKNIIFSDSFDYQTFFPHYNTKNGVIFSSDGKEATSPTLMWLEALEYGLLKMRESIDLSMIAAVSGAAQQHASVYWKKGAEDKLSKLNEKNRIEYEMKDLFAIENSPIWMDSSTSFYANSIQNFLGGPLKMAQITGSSAYERFTINQIAKIIAERKEEYDSCERISLASSFLTSVFSGKYCDIEISDATGMNCFDIKKKQWDQEILNFVESEFSKEKKTGFLINKLGKVVPSDFSPSNVSDYFVKRYGFSPKCKVVNFTGDNPSSLAAFDLQKGEAIISLGTSDTLFAKMDNCEGFTMGHIFCDVIDNDSFYSLLCYQNGSLTREWASNSFSDGKWEGFNEALRTTEPGLKGKFGLYFLENEITPRVKSQIIKIDESGQRFDYFENKKEEIRAVVEGHFLSMRLHSEKLGFERKELLIATGGASSNECILQIISDVFGVPVYVYLENEGSSGHVHSSAALGGAYRAIQFQQKLDEQNKQSKTKIEESDYKIKRLKQRGLVIKSVPNLNAHNEYTSLLEKVRLAESILVPLS